MKKADLQSTLFVGIDISSRENVVCFLDFFSTTVLKSFAVPNNQPGAEQLANTILEFVAAKHDFTKVCVALESTSYYGIHIANYLSGCSELMALGIEVYCLNPKMIANYKKSFLGKSKNDYVDAMVIADFARVGRITSKPWRGSQFLALQRLTRHRLHLSKCLAREKTYMCSNIFLKFSEFSILDNENKPFSNNYGATATAVLTELLSTDDIATMSMENLVDFICSKGKNRFTDPERTAQLLQKAARDSYRLDKVLYEPLTIAIASSFNVIRSYAAELKTVNTAIEHTVRWLHPEAYTVLRSIPGVGPVYAAGLLAELGAIENFSSDNALAKYAGLTWRETQSGNFRADDTTMTKAGNSYFRYYLLEAVGSLIRHDAVYAEFYQKKYDEVKLHQHKRALVLTARKFVRLIFGLLAKNQLYSQSGVSRT